LRKIALKEKPVEDFKTFITCDNTQTKQYNNDVENMLRFCVNEIEEHERMENTQQTCEFYFLTI
jgi:hypothetical protein